MKATRHPHRHLDPRQPRDKTRPGTNPPVFAWRPCEGHCRFRLRVARDAGMREVVLAVDDLTEPAFLPLEAFEPGDYFWQWSSGDEQSELFAFTIAPDSVRLEVPSSDEWLSRFPASHPRLFVRPEDVRALRSRTDAPSTRAVASAADALLAEPHEMDEPPFLPDRRLDYEGWYGVWAPILWESRRFVSGAQTLGLAYLLTGDTRYARAACQRLVSVCRWDPEGSSHLSHNDEAHMSVLWYGPLACDWVWDQFTEGERRRVAEHFAHRGRITYEHMHDRGSYGITRFDSHAGREIVFLAMAAFVFHEDVPEARAWLEWLRPVLCGIWPIWAGDDGGWAEGISYGLAYVNIMTMFATALKAGTGVDLYRRPFWRGHASWRRWCYPPYAEWIGFGDHSERWREGWQANADLVDVIVRQTGCLEFADYAAAFRDEAERCPLRFAEDEGSKGRRAAVNPQEALLPTPAGGLTASPQDHVLEVFPTVGWAAVRTALGDAEQDVAMVFRSSPYGAISHSHANNNDFILHAGGKVLVMPSGYYAGYGSAHHAQWVWHTKSHNCVTLSDAGQLMRSHDSTGCIEWPYEDARLAYLRGNADASYADRARRCRRHVIFLKRHACFLMVDEFEARPGIASAVQWNVHSWAQFDVDEPARCSRLSRADSALAGHVLFHQNGFFVETSGWQPEPQSLKKNEQWLMQYHLRFSPDLCFDRLNLAVILCPSHAALSPPKVETRFVDHMEIAQIGDDLIVVAPAGRATHGGHQAEGPALVIADGYTYQVTAERGLEALS